MGWDELDKNGNPTGQQIMKSEAHRKGLYHMSVHIWLYTPNAQVLIQQRAAGKDTHPLRWDVSVAGHVGAGETVELSAVREVMEEIGLEIHVDDLYKIGVFKSEHQHSHNLIDREFHHTFLCQLSRPLYDLQKQKEEVAQLRLMPLSQLAEETWGLATTDRYVPHGTTYYKTIIRAIQKRLNA
ncbi:MAG: NUDIX domain-containing protein [Flavobacteriaceae bacterium]